MTPAYDPLSRAPDDNSPEDCCSDEELAELLTPSEADSLAFVSSELATAETLLVTGTESLADDVLAELGIGQQAVNVVIAEIGGTAELELDTQLSKLDGIIGRWATEIEKAYNNQADELYHAGVTLPYTVASMVADMQRDPVSMLAERIPAVATLFGGVIADAPDSPPADETGGPEPTQAGPDAAPSLTPLADFAGTPAQSPTPSYAPPTMNGATGLPSGYAPISLFPQSTTPSSPGTTPAPIPPSSPRPTPRPKKPDDECCPVNVTVNVPPPTIVVQQMPASGLTPAGGSSPPDAEDAPGGDTYNYISHTYSPPAAPPAPTPPPTTFRPEEKLVFVPPLTTSSMDRTPVLDWNSYNQCAQLAGHVKGLTNPVAGKTGLINEGNFHKGTAVMQQAAVDAYNWLGVDGKTLQNVVDNTEWGKSLVDSLYSNTLGSKLVERFTETITPDSVRNLNAALLYGGRIGLATKIEQATGMPFGYLMQGEQYALQWSNPQFLPDQGRIDMAYLMGTITSDIWQCWTQANGNLPEPARAVMLANQLKPGVGELVQLFYRGQIGEQDFKDRARQIGILNPAHAMEWAKLFEQLPTQTELLRYMVRDSADEEVAKLYGYDSGFDSKFSGRVREWAKAQGITEDIFKYYWRAHWEIPSNTALYSMFHRLRPDRIERMTWEGLNPRKPDEKEAEYRLRGPVSVSLDDIRQALTVNDVAPAWVDRLLAVSYHPITRTDATRAYLIGAFTTAQLRSALLDNGYSPENAEMLVHFYRLQRRSRLANATGGWTVRKLVSYYRRGLLSESETTARLRRLIDDESELKAIINQAQEQRDADEKAQILKTLRKGFLVGEWDDFEIDLQLQPLGLDVDAKNLIVRTWQRDRDGRFRQPSTEQILGWMQKRLILAPEALIRLTRLGYAARDAEKMIELAIMKGEAKGDLSAEEAGGVFEQAIKSAKDARRESNTRLTTRLAELMREMVRVRNELNRRNDAGAMPPLDPVTVP